jgi:Icc protein
MQESLRLALVTDIHHGEDKLTKRGANALELLDSFLSFAGDWGADMIVELGDRISDVNKETDFQLLSEVASRFEGLNTLHNHLHGNHDVAFLEESLNSKTFSQPNSSFSVEMKGWRLIFWQADTFIPWPETFQIQQSDLQWLESELQKSNIPTIIFTHVPISSGSMQSNYWFQNNPEIGGYPNASEAREIIENSGHVVLCVSGHVHWNSLNQVNAIPHITLQSLTESFTSEGDAAGAWATLEIHKEISWRVYGNDPIEFRLPLRKPGHKWATPLPKFKKNQSALHPFHSLENVEALIFDLDGVLYRDEEPIEHAREFVSWAISEGIKINAITNNAGKTSEEYAQKLQRMGYLIHPDQIITAGMATAQWLAEHTTKPKVHVVGPKALQQELLAAGAQLADDCPDYVVAGISPDITVADLSIATRFIRHGALLVISNPDRTHPTPNGLAPEAGAIRAFLEASGGKPGITVGKPDPYIFRMALSRHKLSPERTLMIGDTIATDIAGGLAAGLLTALVETGNPVEELSNVRPAFRVKNLDELRQLMISAKIKA